MILKISHIQYSVFLFIPLKKIYYMLYQNMELKAVGISIDLRTRLDYVNVSLIES